MTRVVFLVEEPSMADFLNGMLPRFFPKLQFQCVPHNGKQELARSIPRKLRAWREPGVRFVVMQDQDSGDCHEIKSTLAELCQQAERPDTLIRIVCRELEAWYVGDIDAVSNAFPQTKEAALRQLRGARFRNPDKVMKPAKELAKLIPGFQKRRSARSMASVILRDSNRSRSFQVFVEGIQRLLEELQHDIGQAK